MEEKADLRFMRQFVGLLTLAIYDIPSVWATACTKMTTLRHLILRMCLDEMTKPMTVAQVSGYIVRAGSLPWITTTLLAVIPPRLHMPLKWDSLQTVSIIVVFVHSVRIMFWEY